VSLPARVRRCGDRALLVDVDDAAGYAAAVGARSLAGVVEVVPGAMSVLVRHSPASDPLALAALLAGVEPVPAGPARGPVVEIPVVYDGEDLDDVAAATGLARDVVVRLHTAAEYEVAFCGFAPGFAYLRGLDPRLQVPRLATPRTRVPAGSVAVADTWSAVYPRASPGGWRLLGRTAAAVWDEARRPPALLSPGTRVRFVEAGP
jgi:KipI family sensor histidine kinase inhibitor